MKLLTRILYGLGAICYLCGAMWCTLVGYSQFYDHVAAWQFDVAFTLLCFSAMLYAGFDCTIRAIWPESSK